MEEFDKALEQLGWKRIDFARRIGITAESVSRWASPPRYAMAYLEAMLSLKRIRDFAARPIQP